ncbi:MAG: Chromosome partition protein Smc [bacterium ADurb.Bin431]|nr:MAG: Chromosome partition protein Smc [bacterium ADurb.Bin431]
MQDVDCELRALEQSKGDLPQRIASLNREIAQLEESIAEKHDQLKTSRLGRESGALEVASLRDKLKKYQNQLYQVKTNKEYDAITLEIETTQSAIENREFEMLEMEEREKQLHSEIEGLQPGLAELQGQRDEAESRLQAMLAVTRAKEERLQQQRQEIVARIPRPVYSTYERTRIGRGGIAVAFLKEGSCSQCSTRIPPQRGLEIRMMNHLFLCEVCGRIMLYDPERMTVCEGHQQ